MMDQILLAELNESRAEVQRLRERLYTTMPTVHKDLSLISLVPKWSGLEASVPLEEFFSSIEGLAQIGRWDESDKIRIAVLKLKGAAKLFYNRCPQLHTQQVTWETFKAAFSQRFRDVHSDKFHFMQLQTARQKKEESPREFADRCRSLAQRVMCKVDDPVAQRIHRENADRMLLGSFIARLRGEPRKQVRYANPQNIEHALSIALTVQEAENQEKFNETFYTRFDDSVRLLSQSPSRPRREDGKYRRSGDTQAVNHLRGQCYEYPRNANKPSNSGNRNEQTKAAVKCFECQGLGHFAKECPTRLKREKNHSDSRGSRNLSERLRHSRPPPISPIVRKEGK
jgi:GTP cyclohydrolase II